MKSISRSRPARSRAALTAIVGGLSLSLVACQDAVAPTAGRLQAASANRSVGASSVADEYIVTFTSDVHDAPGLAKKLAAESGGELHHTYSAAIKGFSARLSPQAVVALSNNPNIESIEQDQVVTAAGMASTGSQSPVVWGLDRVDQRTATLDQSYSWTNDGSGVVVYIVDSGIRISHNDFGGRASYGVDLIGGSGDDCNGHGTHMAGTVGGSYFGVAKGVSLVAVRVLDCNGQGIASDVVAGLDWVAGHHAPLSIANLSFSSGYNATLNQAVANTMAAGVTVVVSGGDGGVSGYDACTYSPASATSALTVGATRQISGVDYMANISTFGSCIDLFAPGYQITSTWIGVTDGNSWALDGTSSAAAHTSGAAALYLAANPTASPAGVVSGVISAATTGLLSGLGTGSPNRLLYTGTASQPAPPPPSATNLPPTASFTASCSKASCSFDASASKDDGGVVRYDWSFGDGGTGTAATPKTTHIYTQKGSYSVTVNLTVSDAAGLTASYRKTLNIRNNGK